MWALIGLGNPGEQYALTRHNVGFMAVDVIADHYDAPSFKIKGKAALTEININSERIFLCKPQTFMNLSAQAVVPLLTFYKIPLSNVIVFHDDLDLDLGRVKVKQGGGNGGHNGLKSLDQSIGKDYWRVRIGIGHPGYKDAVSGYVLSPFRKDDINGWLPDTLSKISSTLPNFLKNSNASLWMNDLAHS